MGAGKGTKSYVEAGVANFMTSLLLWQPVIWVSTGWHLKKAEENIMKHVCRYSGSFVIVRTSLRDIIKSHVEAGVATFMMPLLLWQPVIRVSTGWYLKEPGEKIMNCEYDLWNMYVLCGLFRNCTYIYRVSNKHVTFIRNVGFWYTPLICRGSALCF